MRWYQGYKRERQSAVSALNLGAAPSRPSWMTLPTDSNEGAALTFDVEPGEDGRQRVRLSGEIDLESSVGLADQLFAVAGSTLVVDLAGVTFMDSSGLAELLTARNKINADGHEFALTSPQERVRRVFEITGLTNLLTD